MSTLETTASPKPFFLYGTAWKEERTAHLTSLALEAGFRGIDTANQLSSFESSLRHLHTDWIDSYVLHDEARHAPALSREDRGAVQDLSEEVLGL